MNLNVEKDTLQGVMKKLVKLKEKDYPVTIYHGTSQYIVYDKSGGVNFAFGMELVFNVMDTELKNSYK